MEYASDVTRIFTRTTRAKDGLDSYLLLVALTAIILFVTDAD